MATRAAAALKSISPPDTHATGLGAAAWLRVVVGRGSPAISVLAEGSKAGMRREGVSADDERPRCGWSADRDCQAIPPGLATTRMAARPSDFLQRTDAAPLTKSSPSTCAQPPGPVNRRAVAIPSDPQLPRRRPAGERFCLALGATRRPRGGGVSRTVLAPSKSFTRLRHWRPWHAPERRHRQHTPQRPRGRRGYALLFTGARYLGEFVQPGSSRRALPRRVGGRAHFGRPSDAIRSDWSRRQGRLGSEPSDCPRRSRRNDEGIG